MVETRTWLHTARKSGSPPSRHCWERRDLDPEGVSCPSVVCSALCWGTGCRNKGDGRDLDKGKGERKTQNGWSISSPPKSAEMGVRFHGRLNGGIWLSFVSYPPFRTLRLTFTPGDQREPGDRYWASCWNGKIFISVWRKSHSTTADSYTDCID